LPFGFTEALVPFRESTPLLRYMTGLLFGIGTAWFGYPLVEATMRDSRSLLQAKAERIARQQSNEVESKN
jgi:peptidoglycan/LPS O-acetylase OafA/YrhL